MKHLLLSPAGRSLRALLGAALSLIGLIGLGGCASPAKAPVPVVQVILLPQPGDQPTGVVIQTGQTVETLTQPYRSVSAAADQPPSVGTVEPAQVEQTYAPLFKVAPPKGVRYLLYFQPGTTRLTADSQAELPRIQAETGRHPGVEILVVGHTDTTGTLEANDALSLRRAREVGKLLEQSGLPAGRIEAIGRGERELAVPTADEVNEPLNRRVEILVR
ncbi:MAG: OmpA family protein [Curvibacter sp.]|nr:OmpA family protein [Curvibacter sp.]